MIIGFGASNQGVFFSLLCAVDTAYRIEGEQTRVDGHSDVHHALHNPGLHNGEALTNGPTHAAQYYAMPDLFSLGTIQVASAERLRPLPQDR